MQGHNPARFKGIFKGEIEIPLEFALLLCRKAKKVSLRPQAKKEVFLLYIIKYSFDKHCHLGAGGVISRGDMPALTVDKPCTDER